MSKQKFYAVLSGRETGVYTTWSECEAQVKGFKGAEYKSYSTRDQAELALSTGNLNIMNEEHVSVKQTVTKRAVNRGMTHTHFICCDAAFSHKSKELEYRTVEVVGSIVNEVHRSPVYIGGSANVGEFLGILDSLVWMGRNGKTHLPLYSDSYTAQVWVKKGFPNSGVAMSRDLEKAFWARCEALKAGKYDKLIADVELLDWKTKEWGLEIPADFGRKNGGSGSDGGQYSARYRRTPSKKGKFK